MSTTGTTPEPPDPVELEVLRSDAELYRWVRERAWYVDAAADALGLTQPRRSWSDVPPKPDWDEVEEALAALIRSDKDYVSPYE